MQILIILLIIVVIVKLLLSIPFRSIKYHKGQILTFVVTDSKDYMQDPIVGSFLGVDEHDMFHLNINYDKPNAPVKEILFLYEKETGLFHSIDGTSYEIKI